MSEPFIVQGEPFDSQGELKFRPPQEEDPRGLAVLRRAGLKASATWRNAEEERTLRRNETQEHSQEWLCHKGVRHPANSLNPPREPFLFKILAKSVVVFCFLLLIECSHKGWLNERGVGNIVSCRCESEHQNRPSGLPCLFSARCDGTRRSLPGHHVSTLEILSAVQGRIEILHMDAQSGAEHGDHPHSAEYPGPSKYRID